MVLSGHPHRLGLQHPAVLALPLVQPHADKTHVVADGAVQAVAAHMHLWPGRQFEVHGRQRAVLVARVHGGEPGAQRVVQFEGHRLDAQRCEDTRLQDLAQAFTGDALHHLAAPVEVGAVFPALAGIEQQRRHQRRFRRLDHTGLALFLGQPLVGFVAELVTEAGGVQQQHTGGDRPRRRAQARLPVGVKTLDHHKLADVGHVIFGRGVEVEPALLHQLQNGRAGDRLGGGEDRKHAVRRHRDLIA